MAGTNEILNSYSWDRVTNTSGFAPLSGTPGATPVLPSSLTTDSAQNLATPGVSATTYYVKFTSFANGVLTLNGDQYFQLSNFSTEDTQVLNIGSQSAGVGAGHVTFDPLQLTFSQQILTPSLLNFLTTGSGFSEVDVIGYSSTGHIVEQDSYGLAGVSDLSLASNSGNTSTVSLQYGSEAVSYYQPDANGILPNTPTLTDAWNSVKNVSGFSTNGTNTATPTAGPTTLSPTASNVAAASNTPLDYYIRFTQSNGTVVTVGTGSLFALSNFKFEDTQVLNIQSGTLGAGKATFDPLNLTFQQSSLDPQFLQMLASGTPFKEVDVLGYAPSSAPNAGQIVEDYNFGLVGAGDLSTGPDSLTHLSLQYGSEAITYYGSPACYCEGTVILTEHGEVAVEHLAIGDKLVTAMGAIRPIKWIGTRSYSGRFVAFNHDLWPICFKAGSLEDNSPTRDLWVSPHHAMYLDSMLIEAKDLVNGMTIVQATPAKTIVYYHIEFESHDVIIAEGAFSESYINDDNRGMFHNEHEYSQLYPNDAPAELARYCAPRVDAGEKLQIVRARLSSRARKLFSAAESLAS